jgi:putative DNA primase/helicase
MNTNKVTLEDLNFDDDVDFFPTPKGMVFENEVPYTPDPPDYKDEVIPTPVRKIHNLNSPTMKAIKGGDELEIACMKKYGFYYKDLVTKKIFDKKESTLDVEVIPHAYNIKVIIENKYPGVKYSVFHDRLFIGDDLMEEDFYDEMSIFLSKSFNKSIKVDEIKTAIRFIAKENKFDPLKDYFNNLPETKTSYLDSWLFDICGVERTEINRIIGRKWLIGGVARALKPGCAIEGALILFGKQGKGKSTFFKNICPDASMYCGSEINISNVQSSAITLKGKFILEFAELSALQQHKSSLEDIKSFLTAPEDTYRPLYSNIPVTIPRRILFGGTTNRPNILSDSENRRFWCVEVDKIDFEKIKEIRHNLWREALDAFNKGEIWHLTDEEKQMLEVSNETFGDDDPLKEHLEDYLGFIQDEFVTSKILQKEVYDNYNKKVGPQTISLVMTKLGWIRKKITSGENKDRVAYFRPEGSKVNDDFGYGE